jgi:hypothetical protein
VAAPMEQISSIAVAPAQEQRQRLVALCVFRMCTILLQIAGGSMSYFLVPRV